MKTSKGKTKVQPMAGPGAKPAFRKTAKKPEADDLPGKMKKGHLMKKLEGKRI